MKPRRAVPIPTIRRLPAYLVVLRELQASGHAAASAPLIAGRLSLEPIQVRKDLANTGAVGRPRIGFEIAPTIADIERFLGWDCATQAFLVGAGHLGSALLGYQEFARHGLDIVAAFDNDPGLTGQDLDGKQILPLGKLPDLARRMHIHVGVLAVPADAAQDVAETLVAAGIRGIWNFAPRKLHLPENIIVQNENLSAGLAVLTAKVSEALASDHPQTFLTK